MPNSLLSQFRQQFPEDDRSDPDLTLAIGDLLEPETRQKFPDFDAQYKELELERRIRQAPPLTTELGTAFRGSTAGLASTALGGAGMALRGVERLPFNIAAAMPPGIGLARAAAEAPVPLSRVAAEKAKEQIDIQAQHPSTIHSVEEAIKSGEYAQYLAGATGQALPSLIEAGLVAIGGAVMGSGAGPVGTGGGLLTGVFARQAVKRLLRSQIDDALKAELGQLAKGELRRELSIGAQRALGEEAKNVAKQYGANVATGLNSYLLNAGEIYNDLTLDPQNPVDPDKAFDIAVTGGFVSAIPDTFLPSYVTGRILGAKTGKPITEAVKRSFYPKLARFAGEVAKTTGIEGATEGFQEWVGIASERYANGQPIDAPLTEEDRSRILNAATIGGIAGFIAGPISGLAPEQRQQRNDVLNAAERAYFPTVSDERKQAIIAAEMRKRTGQTTEQDVTEERTRTTEERNLANVLAVEMDAKVAEKAAEDQLIADLSAPLAPDELPLTPPREPVNAANLIAIAQHHLDGLRGQTLNESQQARWEQIVRALGATTQDRLEGLATLFDLELNENAVEMPNRFGFVQIEQPRPPSPTLTPAQLAARQAATRKEPSETEGQVTPTGEDATQRRESTEPVAEGQVEGGITQRQDTGAPQPTGQAETAIIPQPTQKEEAVTASPSQPPPVAGTPTRAEHNAIVNRIGQRIEFEREFGDKTSVRRAEDEMLERAGAYSEFAAYDNAVEKIKNGTHEWVPGYGLRKKTGRPAEPTAAPSVEPSQPKPPPPAESEVTTTSGQAGVRGEVKAVASVAKSPAEMNPREFDEFAKTTPLESQIHGANRFPTRDEAIAAINAVEASRESPGAFRPQRIGDQWMVVASHPAFIAEAVRQKQPVSAIAIQAYQYKLPSGYVREGDLQVYKPQPPTKPAAKEEEEVTAGVDAGMEFPNYPTLPEKAIPGSDVFKTHRDNVRAWEERVRAWLVTKSEKKAIIWEEPEREYGKGNVKALTRNIGNPDKPWRVTTYYEREGKYIPAGHQEYATREAALFEEGRSEGRAPNKFHESMPGTVMTEQEIQGYKMMADIEDASTLTWYHIGNQSTAALHNKLRGSELSQDFVRDSLTPDGLVAFTKPVEKRHADNLGISAIEVKTITFFDPSSVEVVELPIEKLKLSKDVPNFKADASEATGVVSGQELEGKYERRGTAPIVVWERLNGDLEVITGRHRLDLASRTGEKTIPSQVVREANGFTKEMALTFDAESNIRDGQGDVSDYAQYFKYIEITEKEAGARGLLSRAKGRAGWSLAKAASDDLYALWRDGKLTENQAVTIADAAPGDASAQRIGIKFGLQGKPPEFLSNVIKAIRTEAGARGETLDLFGSDDAAMKTMAVRAERAANFQRDIAEQIRAVQGAAKRPEQARKLGVDVKDPEAVTRKVGELKAELVRWENWPTQPDLAAKVKGESVKTTAPPLELDKPESVEEQKVRLAAEAEAKKPKPLTEQEKIQQLQSKGLFGTTGDLGQGDLLEGPGDLFAPPQPAAEKPIQFGSQNKIVSTERADELRQRIKDKLNRTNLGVDPTIFTDAVQLGAYYIEAGYHRFSDWSAKMLEDFGDAIKDHLRSIYETARVTIESPGGESRSGEPAGLQPGLRPPGERIVAARGEQTRRADESVIPSDLIKYLDPHQRQGAASALIRLGKGEGFLLADGTGAGKTRQALTVAAKYARDGRKVIIVTKAETIKPNWKENTFGGSYGYDSDQMGVKVKLARDGAVRSGEIGITTYENLDKVAVHTDQNTLLIFDESHALKNDSQRARHGVRAIAKADNAMFMSATPADKAEHIYYLARMGVTEGKTIQQALRDLGMTLVTMDKMVKEGTRWVKRSVTFWAEDQRVSDQERNQRFSALFDRLTANGAMLKREISMDGVHVQVLKIGLPPEAHAVQKDILKFFDADHIDDLSGLKKATVLGHQRRQQEPYKIASTVMLAQRELAAGRQVVIFVSRVNASEVGKWVKVQGLTGESERVRETLMRSEGTAKTMREALEDAGIHDIAEIHGNADQGSLEAMADFQAGKKRVVIATIESGGTGINLDDIAGNRPRSMIVVTAPFDAVGNVQAAGRIWRLKTLSKSNLFYLFGDTSVDEWNADIIGSKMATLGAVVEGQVRRLDISDPDFVTTDEYHEKVQQPTDPAIATPTELPALDWRPFKTKAGADKFVAEATPEFWSWWTINGGKKNAEGIRVSKYQDRWQVWSDKPSIPKTPNVATPLTPPTYSASDLALREGETEEAHRERVRSAARTLGIDPSIQPDTAKLARLVIEKQEAVRNQTNPPTSFPSLPNWTEIEGGPMMEPDRSLDPVIAASNGSALGVLRHIAQNSTNPFYRLVAQKLADAGVNPRVERMPDGDAYTQKYGQEISALSAGVFNSEENLIVLTDWHPNQEQIFLHEMIHAASVQRITQNPAFRAQLSALRLLAEKAWTGPYLYGLKNDFEFLAESLSDPYFQSFLQNTRIESRSLWSRFVDFIRGLLGLSTLPTNLLEETFRVSAPVFLSRTMPIDAMVVQDRAIRLHTTTASSPVQAETYNFGDATMEYADAVEDSVEAAQFNTNNSVYLYNPAPPIHEQIDLSNRLNIDAAVNNHDVALETKSVAAIKPESLAVRLATAKGIPLPKLLRQVLGLKDTEAVANAVLARATDRQGNPVPFNAAQQLDNFMQGGASRDRVLTRAFHNTQAALLRIGKKKADAQARIAANEERRGALLDTFNADLKNYTDADALTSQQQGNVRKMLTGLIKNFVQGMRRLGQIEQQLNELEGQKDEPIPRRYYTVFQELFTGNELRGTNLFDLLEKIATDSRIDLTQGIRAVRVALRAANDPAYAKLTQDTETSKALLATVVAYGKANAKMMAMLELRRMKAGEERAKINNDMRELLKAGRDDLLKQIRRLPRLAVLEERARQAYREQLKRVLALQRQVERDTMTVELADAAMPVYNDGFAELVRQLQVSPQFVFRDGALFYHPPSYDASDEQVKAVERQLTLDSIGQPVEKAALTQYLDDAGLWLMNRDRQAAQGNRAALTPLYYAVKRQRDTIFQHRFYTAQKIKTDRKHIELYLLDAAKAIESLGFGPAREISRMLREFQTRLDGIWPSVLRDHVNRSEREERRVLGVLNRGRPKEPIDAQKYREHILFPVMQLMEQSRGLEERYAGDSAGLESALRNRAAAWLMKQDYVRKLVDGREQEFFRHLFEHVSVIESASAYAHSKVRERTPVRDPTMIMKEDAAVRRATRVGPKTFSRKYSQKVFGNMVSAMDLSGWVDFVQGVRKGLPGEEGEASSIAELYNSGQQDLLQAWYQRFFFDPIHGATIQDVFFKELANLPLQSVFDAPVLSDGVTRLEADPPLVSEAYELSNGDPVKFFEFLYDAHDGESDKGQYVEEGLKRLALIYQQTHQDNALFQDEPNVEIVTLRGMVAPIMSDARIIDNFPGRWFDYHTYDHQDGYSVTKRIAAQDAFGYQSATLAYMFQSLRKEIARDLTGLANIEASILNADPLIRKKEMREESIRRIGNKIEFERLDNLRNQMGRKGNFLDGVERALIDFFRNQNDPIVTMRTGIRFAGFIAGRLVEAPGPAITQLAALADPIVTFGVSLPTIKFVARNIATVGRELVNGLGYAIGVEWLKSGRYEQNFRALGLTEPSVSRQAGDAFNQRYADESRLARGMRFISDAQSFALKWPGTTPTGSTIKPLAPFRTIVPMVNKALAQNTVRMVEDYLLKAKQFLDTNESAYGDPEHAISPKDMGLGPWDRQTFERLRGYLSGWGLDFDAMAREAKRRLDKGESSLISNDDWLRLNSLSLHEISLEPGLVTTPFKVHGSGFMQLALPLLRWQFARAVQVFPSGRLDAEGQASARALLRMLAGVAFTGLTSGIALSLLVEEYNKRLLGKKQNLRPILGGDSPEDTALALLERTARVGVFGSWGELVNTGINVGTGQGDNRSFSLDQRIVAANAIYSFLQAGNSLIHQGEFDYARVGRPAITALGGSGMLQYAQIVNRAAEVNLLGEGDYIKRLNVRNILRVAGRQLDMDVQPARAGYEAPTPLTPYITRMDFAVYRQNPSDFKRAYREAIEKADDLGRPDPVRSVQQAFSSRHPLRTVFRASVTEGDYRRILQSLPDDEREDVQDAVKLFNRYGSSIGVSEFTGVERRSPAGTGLPRLSSYDIRRLSLQNLGASSIFR